MLFNSWVFVAFFCAFFPIYLLIHRHVRIRNTWLLVCSYFFYGWWNPRFVTLLAILAAVDYLAALGVSGGDITQKDRGKCATLLGLTTIALMPFVDPDQGFIAESMATASALILGASYAIQKLDRELQRKAWLCMSIFANLGMLAFFKYCNFFLENLNLALRAIGLPDGPGALHILLPIGLSFHVFQGISRTVDCYRGDIKAEGSLTSVATYLAFFPQLVAGPIERAARLIPQFERVADVSWNRFASGGLLFLWGLYQKLVVADNVAPIANQVFGDTSALTGGQAAAGTLAFTVQIYCDFAGYSNMARGLARTIGFDLMANFNFPYFSRTPSEFWRRWHISLSSWLRDYLYIFLGGNRGGRASMYRNLLLTMLLGGLWHGAAWTFVMWGLFHGTILVAYRVLQVDRRIEECEQGSWRSVLINLSTWLATMILVMIGWIYFRATSIGDAHTIIATLLTSGAGYSWDAFATIAVFAGPLAVVEIYQRLAVRPEALAIGPFWLRYTATVTVVLALFLFSAKGGQEFIYFDF